MLIDFKFKNFKSFKNEVVFSMEPTSHNGKPVNEIETKFKDIKTVFRTSAVFGANASGKSNFIDALIFLRLMVGSSYSNAIDSKLKFEKYALGGEDEQLSSFEVRYIKDEYIYKYGFTLDNHKIYKEFLYYTDNKSSSEKLIFERSLNEKDELVHSAHNSDIIPNDGWMKEVISTRLFLSELVNNRNNSNSHILNAYIGITEFMILKSKYDIADAETLHRLDNDKENIIQFLNKADFNICNIKIKDLGIDDIFKMRNYELFSTHKTEDGREVDFNFNSFESDGTKIVFALSGLVIRALQEGITLIIDEMDKSLHPLLVKYITNMFNNPETNKKNAQLIFTSHSHYLMDGETLSRDQIWFTSKENGFYSQLYSLSDFKELKRKKDRFYNEYMYGIFGAIPNVKED